MPMPYVNVDIEPGLKPGDIIGLKSSSRIKLLSGVVLSSEPVYNIEKAAYHKTVNIPITNQQLHFVFIKYLGKKINKHYSRESYACVAHSESGVVCYTPLWWIDSHFNILNP